LSIADRTMGSIRWTAEAGDGSRRGLTAPHLGAKGSVRMRCRSVLE
jgi:hypothetical protein